jgi:glutamate--cysteine ligase
VIFQGERPLHALRERGVEYVEVRLLDLNPFEPVGINAQTLRFIDVFLLYCLTQASPPDTAQEIAAMARNQHRTAERGREPGLLLERADEQVPLTAWAAEILAAMRPLAERLDAINGSTGSAGSDDSAHAHAVQAARQALEQPHTLPSARVLQSMTEDHAGSFLACMRAHSEATQAAMLSEPLPPAVLQSMQAQSAESLAAQRRIEAADTMPFDVYLQAYLSPRRLLASGATTG